MLRRIQVVSWNNVTTDQLFVYYGSTALCWALAAFSVYWSYIWSVGLFGRVISPSQGLYLHIEHKHRINAHNTDIHALSGIRTHDPRVRASKGSTDQLHFILNLQLRLSGPAWLMTIFFYLTTHSESWHWPTLMFYGDLETLLYIHRSEHWEGSEAVIRRNREAGCYPIGSDHVVNKKRQ
jgi:hypothetical protein